MDSVAWTLLSVLLLSLSAHFYVWAQVRVARDNYYEILRSKGRRIDELEMHARANTLELERLRSRALHADWLDWWIRNAAEGTPLDPIRIHLLRFAVAATLAPSLEQFRADLRALSRAEHVGNATAQAAEAFLIEMALPEAPWKQFDREKKARHRTHAVTAAYRALLDRGWIAFLDPNRELSNSPLGTVATQKA